MTAEKIIHLFICIAFPALLLAGCKKWIEIDPPIDTITTGEMFSSNKEAEWAMAAVYSKLINGMESVNISNAAESNFGSGLPTILGGVSADEFVPSPTLLSGDYLRLSSNSLTVKTSGVTTQLWTTAYKIIFDANGVIEGIEGSKSHQLTDSVRKQLTGEALALRAFAYFYLVNFFGDLPLVLTVDFNQTAGLSRAPAGRIYEQITADLRLAKTLLSADFAVGKGERVRVNKWFAEALLARVSLYTGDFQQAVASATAVIGETGLFGLEGDVANVFLKNSREAILQLKQAHTNEALKNATPEGMAFNPWQTGIPPRFHINSALPDMFGETDKRKTSWIAHIAGIYYPFKYKTGNYNAVYMGEQTEYYTVMRLAEMYLVRAEASVRLSGANAANAIKDLNEVRGRAGAAGLPETLTAQQVTDAVAKERQLELFAEWGHRWLDLKRTGKASSVLSAMPHKQPWKGDYQLLYPIPEEEIRNNNNLVQNPQYNNQ